MPINSEPPFVVECIKLDPDPMRPKLGRCLPNRKHYGPFLSFDDAHAFMQKHANEWDSLFIVPVILPEDGEQRQDIFIEYR